ncbi:amidase signature enzyme [Aspergillus homomorphus CBS 101889]|uniref:Amidase signature enzyme n=1 Tax=Aspergillus homomorphus (strain CBS 101889) TaxID=1450537 RepID=A0A395HJE0_ASPHC|nr:amidase signature enzyme [Aspergillus homomorphus CBS 101889]RAL07746.1 amidase signature enzyme [Aspergillus homomorphus CBS 101889]
MGSAQQWEQIVARKRLLRIQSLEPYVVTDLGWRISRVYHVHERTVLHDAPEVQEITNIYGIPQLLEQLKLGRITAEQTTSAYIKRYCTTNCLTEFVFEEALVQARELDRHFQLTLKDQFNINGIDSILGYVGRSFSPAREDAVLVQLLRDMGAIVLAKTNLPQSIMGLTLNPRDSELTPGGSTGGDAVLLALRGSNLGRLPYHGVPVSTEGQEHVPSSIGPMGRDLLSLCYVTRAISAFQKIQSRRMVIGLILDDGVVRVHPPIERVLLMWNASDHQECIQLMDLFYTVDGGEDVRRDVGAAGEPYIPHVETLVNRGKAIAVYEYWQLNKRKRIDVLLAPTTPHSAVPHRSLRWVGYTKIWNFLDYPAVTFPVPTDYRSRNELDTWNWKLYDPKAMDGHPLNLQVIGRKLEEEVVLGAANAIETLWKSMSKVFDR